MPSLGTAYGLNIASAIALPELRAPVGDVASPDLVITLDTIDPSALHAMRAIGPLSWASPTEIAFEVPGVARYRISAGQRIVIDPQPGIDEASLRLFLFGSALAAVLLQRGLVRLHGCAVTIDGGACIAVGHSGVGKSTLAEGLRRRGFPVFADDVVAIDANNHVLVGIPRIKLWDDVVATLGLDPAALKQLRPDLAKYDVGIGDAAPRESAPARWIYALDTHHAEAVTVTRVTGMEAFALLRRNSYRARFADAIGLKATHLRRAMEVAASARLANVRRPSQGFSLDALVDAIQDDVRR
jgi:hypothetical protein